MIVKIHLTLILMFLYNYFFGKLETLFICYMFIIMHELSHMIVALLLKIDIEEICLMPVGVNAKYLGRISPLKELIISISGPIGSLIFAFLYNNKIYYLINICIVIFNIIPIYPLDGGRVLRVLLKFIFGDKIGQNISTYLTNILVIIFLLVGIFIAAYYKNFFFLIVSIYIYRISKNEIKKDKIIRAINYLQTDK